MSDNFTRKNKECVIYCANCGCIGHIYKSCNHPVTSYGVICYQLFYDSDNNCVYPKYLMVQRKDSLSYVEFVRGKYDIQNRKYLMKLFMYMTEGERNKIKQSKNFNTLWADMWCRSIESESNKNFNKEYLDSASKYDSLKTGVYIKTCEDETIFFDLDYLLNNTKSTYDQTEWGFAKGRRNINEDDITCALREFREETGISMRHIRLCHDIKPCEEIFSGSNRIRYKHVYYIARYVSSFPYTFDPSNVQQNREIKDARWFSYTEAQQHIREQNIERKELFKRINTIIMKTSVIKH